MLTQEKISYLTKIRMLGKEHMATKTVVLDNLIAKWESLGHRAGERTVFAFSDAYSEGYREGFETGFAEGYRSSISEQITDCLKMLQRPIVTTEVLESLELVALEQLLEILGQEIKIATDVRPDVIGRI